MANVVPINDRNSRINNYGITEEDNLTHLDLGFKFYDLTDNVHRVLGQTHRFDYVNKLSVSANMPVMGGTPWYAVSDIFSTNHVSHPKNPKYINCCLIGIIRIYFKSLEEKI
ncbi:hypothetical protein OsJ_23982 [Oryza sativa Japonica Group]|uniref:Uncharacterized protein n=1 Tax=Oryza sativa subsp. japonica TaxID=39947 RepID=B9FWV3_ORYSJ|nr:hypothetical protein OsJ_23982 [Oryza sativa Japonica Group]